MRALGVDLGSRRIGLALSDPGGVIASPAGTLERRGRRQDLEALREWIVRNAVEQVVVGLPIHMNGRLGPEARAAQEFARALEAVAGVPVATLDERWTTREAERALRESGAGRARRREAVDAVAAAIILRTWLARRTPAAPDPTP
jgi:putative Holliday junction resolvase